MWWDKITVSQVLARCTEVYICLQYMHMHLTHIRKTRHLQGVKNTPNMQSQRVSHHIKTSGQ